MLGSTHPLHGGYETPIWGNEVGTCDGPTGISARVQSGGHSNAALEGEESIMTYQLGDIVYLNSGSPALLVVELDEEKIIVSWPADDGEIQEMELPAVCVHP
jgi:hypothetical protein